MSTGDPRSLEHRPDPHSLLEVFAAWADDPPGHGIALLPEGTEATEIFSRETNMGPSLSLTLSW